MSSSDQSPAFKLDLKGFTPRQYAALILRDELKYSYGKAGLKMGINYRAFARLYGRAKQKKAMSKITNNLCNVCEALIPDQEVFCEKCKVSPYYLEKYYTKQERLYGVIEDSSEYYDMDDDS